MEWILRKDEVLSTRHNFIWRLFNIEKEKMCLDKAGKPGLCLYNRVCMYVFISSQTHF